MVDLEQQSGLPLFRTRWASPPSTEETYEHGQSAKLLQGSETTVGWISRQKPRPPVEAELFS